MTSAMADHASLIRPMKKPRIGSEAFVLEYSYSLFRLADGNLQRADAVDAALDLVAGVELGDAGRRARHDDVTGGGLDLLRQLPDDLRQVPNQFGEAALLGFRAVDGVPDLALGWEARLCMLL